MQTTGQVGTLVGPLLGGVLSAFYNPVFVMVINGATFLVSAVFLLAIVIREIPDPEIPPVPGLAGVFFEVREGIGFVFSHNPLFLGLFVIMTLYGVISGPVTLLLPVLSKTLLHAGAGGFGMLLSAYGVGMLLSSIFLTVRPPVNLFRWIAGGFLAGGVTMLLMAGSSLMVIDLGLMLLFGMAVSVVNPLAHTLMQNNAPSRMLSRVLTTMSLGFLGGAILGMVGLPGLVERTGIRVVLALLGGVLVLSWGAVNLIEAGCREDSPCGSALSRVSAFFGRLPAPVRPSGPEISVKGEKL
jgi:hypothetical protein